MAIDIWKGKDQKIYKIGQKSLIFILLELIKVVIITFILNLVVDVAKQLKILVSKYILFR